jgi:hypothetical protein
LIQIKKKKKTNAHKLHRKLSFSAWLLRKCRNIQENKPFTITDLKKKIHFHQLNRKAHSKTLVWFLKRLQEEDGF